MEQAFATLRNHARNHNLRLVDVATDVIGGRLRHQASTFFPDEAHEMSTSTGIGAASAAKPLAARCAPPGRW